MRAFLPLLLLLATGCTPALAGLFPGVVYPGAQAVAQDRPAVHRWVLRDADGVALDIEVTPDWPAVTPSWERDKRRPKPWLRFTVDAQWSDDRSLTYATATGLPIVAEALYPSFFGDPACASAPLVQIDPGRTEGGLEGVPMMQSGEPWTAPVYALSKGACEPTEAPGGAPLTPLVPVPPELANRFHNPPYTVTWE